VKDVTRFCRVSSQSVFYVRSGIMRIRFELTNEYEGVKGKEGLEL